MHDTAAILSNCDRQWLEKSPSREGEAEQVSNATILRIRIAHSCLPVNQSGCLIESSGFPGERERVGMRKEGIHVREQEQTSSVFELTTCFHQMLYALLAGRDGENAKPMETESLPMDILLPGGFIRE